MSDPRFKEALDVGVNRGFDQAYAAAGPLRVSWGVDLKAKRKAVEEGLR
ncbi:MAG TPA: hypothetical protein VFO25_09355 [Candidatus Eremiobacteraceae bacterium]|nr:hypothetical protein [Candidatus Eremiobacteraceae bacterium]